MKKILALALALLLALGMMGALAAEEPENTAAPKNSGESTATVKKVYKLASGADDTAKSPAETFSFTDLTCTGVTNAAVGVTPENAPLPTIGNVTFTEGAATTEGAKGTVTITLPTYTGVGIYTYTFKENDGKKLGVTYNSGKFTLVVTVQRGDDGVIRATAVHCESDFQAVYVKDGNEVDESGTEITTKTKTDTFENTYTAGKLTINKQVTGNMGDVTKTFKVKVKFEAPSGKTLASTIKYSGGSITEEKTVDKTTYEAEIEIKHGETITFENIPDGTIYSVEETDYTGDGYVAAKYSLNGTDKNSINKVSKSGTSTDAVVITNEKNADVDTGITLDTLPYLLVLAAVAVGAVLMMARKRRSQED